MTHGTRVLRSTALVAFLATSFSAAACSGDGPTGPSAVADAPAHVVVTLNVSSWDFHAIGEKAQLHATVSGSPASPLWESSDHGVAIIDEDGLLTATGAGMAMITAWVGTAYAEVIVSVTPTSTVFDSTQIGH